MEIFAIFVSSFLLSWLNLLLVDKSVAFENNVFWATFWSCRDTGTKKSNRKRESDATPCWRVVTGSKNVILSTETAPSIRGRKYVFFFAKTFHPLSVLSMHMLHRWPRFKIAFHQFWKLLKPNSLKPKRKQRRLTEPGYCEFKINGLRDYHHDHFYCLSVCFS